MEANGNVEGYATVDGAIAPVDPKRKPINFRVILPVSWYIGGPPEQASSYTSAPL
ncbi:MAG: hypothetical protein ABIO94_01500 [Opitutaceae bacterium]